jgi:hypothetical protein
VFNPGVDSLCGLSQTLYLLGYPDQARQRAQEALALARELAYSFTLAEALMQSARQELLTLRQRLAVVRREEEEGLGQEEDLR